ncbi:hypothetical protein RJ641_031969 [Dillenia turbinata]|uniref:Uncharacterized protein n=1 Tax=Dillenia turbinata TaxID=194707 RepID=A0AAN8ZHT3_9MAGN
MERSEPTLVPEWLRSAGSATGGGSSTHHFASSLHSDNHSLSHSTRNRSSKSISDYDIPRSAFVDRTSSSNSRRSSGSNGSAKHDKDSYLRPYSSFSIRSPRDRERDKDRERLTIGDRWDHDSSDPLPGILIGRDEKDALRRSRSMVARKQVELSPRNVVKDIKNGSSESHNNSNGVILGSSAVSSIKKAVFEKDFPSLGSDERQSDIARVPSPGLSSSVQSLPLGHSALIGGEGWTSALANVPPMVPNNTVGASSVQQTLGASPVSMASSAMAGLNMAEALAQAPARARTPPELSVKTQRLEELAIKQSRQLIPVTPSMPKASVLNSDKPKAKSVSRSGEGNVTAKSVQQQPSSHLGNQSLRSGPVRLDAPKTSHTGKFLVLKPGRENGVPPSPRDSSSPPNNSNSTVVNNQLAAAPSGAPSPARSPGNSKGPGLERKVAASALNPGFTLDKKPSFSQTQSRIDFFNRMRQKTSMKNSSTVPESESGPVSSLSEEKSEELIKESVIAPPSAIQIFSEVTSNGDACQEPQGFSDVAEKNLTLEAAVYPDEEEAAFLRSLGWEENAGEDEGLTEEEINSFYQEYMKLRPSSRLCKSIQPKLRIPSESHGASSEIISSGSEAEA